MKAGPEPRSRNRPRRHAASDLDIYIKRFENTPNLTAEDEAELSRKMKGAGHPVLDLRLPDHRARHRPRGVHHLVARLHPQPSPQRGEQDARGYRQADMEAQPRQPRRSPSRHEPPGVRGERQLKRRGRRKPRRLGGGQRVGRLPPRQDRPEASRVHPEEFRPRPPRGDLQEDRPIALHQQGASPPGHRPGPGPDVECSQAIWSEEDRMIERLVRAWGRIICGLRRRRCDGRGCRACIPIEICPLCERWHPMRNPDEGNVCRRCVGDYEADKRRIG